jgi:hypothetical protein
MKPKQLNFPGDLRLRLGGLNSSTGRFPGMHAFFACNNQAHQSKVFSYDLSVCVFFTVMAALQGTFFDLGVGPIEQGQWRDQVPVS